MAKETADADKMKKRVDEITAQIKEKLRLDKELGKKIRGYSDKIADDTTAFLLSILPTETQKHLLSSNKEALMAAQSMINIGIKNIEKHQKGVSS
jgi:hypothetical protein